MQNISTTFRIAVNISKEKIKEILRRYQDCYMISFNESNIIIERNNVVINDNYDYDKKLSIEDEDGYLYYESNMDFYPKDDNIILEDQIEIAKEISRIFCDNGIASEIIAEFEDLL